MANIKGILRELGLNQKESNVLLALYTLKKATVAGIARQSALPRTTIYTALAKLLDKQMVMRAKVGKRELWEAVTPKRLLAIKQEQINQLKSIVPELEKLAILPEIVEKSTVVQYKGTHGLQRVYDMILELGKGERAFGFEGGRSSEKKMDVLPEEYSRGWHAAVKRKGIILEVAVSEKLLDVIRKATPEMREVARGRATITYVLPDEVMNFDSDILVFGHRVAIVTPKNLSTVVINDYVTSLAFRQLIKTACMMGEKIDLNSLIAGVKG